VLVARPAVALDPLLTGDVVTRSMLANVYEGLVEASAGQGLTPGLAVAWSNPSDDVWRLELRQGVRFHDGRELDSRDVVESLERGRLDPGSWSRDDLSRVRSVRATGTHALEIETHGPSPLLLNELREVPILPAGVRPTRADNAVGTGRYRIVAWEGPGALELAGFADHWAGAPRWDRVEFGVEMDPAARVRALRAGDYDLVEAPEESLLGELESAGFEVISHAAASVVILGFRVVDEPDNPFADPAVREAISLALDREALVREIFPRTGAVATQLAPPGVFGYVPGQPLPAYDPVAARARLAASRWPRGFEAGLGCSPGRQELARFVARSVGPLGIRLEPELLSWAELDERLQAVAQPAYLFLMTYPTLETGALLDEGFHTRRPGGGRGILNFSGYSSPALDELIARTDVELDPRRRLALLQEGMRRVGAERVWLPLAVSSLVWAARPGIEWEETLSGRMELEGITATGY
jgi:peptide/nickel transport system substrate-binding protein